MMPLQLVIECNCIECKVHLGKKNTERRTNKCPDSQANTWCPGMANKRQRYEGAGNLYALQESTQNATHCQPPPSPATPPLFWSLYNPAVARGVEA